MDREFNSQLIDETNGFLLDFYSGATGIKKKYIEELNKIKLQVTMIGDAAC